MGEVTRKGGGDAAADGVADQTEARCTRPRQRGRGDGEQDLGCVETLVVGEVGGGVAVAAAPEVLWTLEIIQEMVTKG